MSRLAKKRSRSSRTGCRPWTKVRANCPHPRIHKASFIAGSWCPWTPSSTFYTLIEIGQSEFTEFHRVASLDALLVSLGHVGVDLVNKAAAVEPFARNF